MKETDFDSMTEETEAQAPKVEEKEITPESDTFAPLEDPATAPVEAEEDDEDDAPVGHQMTEEEQEAAELEKLKENLPRGEFKRIKNIRQQRKEAVEAAAAERARADALEAELEALKAEREDPEPDPAEDLEEYKAWVRRDTERKLKINVQGFKGYPSKDAPPANNTDLDEMREAVRQEFRDYDRFVSKAVLHTIDTDPLINDRVWQSKNPPREAYEVGRELILGKSAKPQLSGAGNGYRPPVVSRSNVTLTPEERKISAIFGSEKDLIEQRSRKAGGR